MGRCKYHFSCSGHPEVASGRGFWDSQLPHWETGASEAPGKQLSSPRFTDVGWVGSLAARGLLPGGLGHGGYIWGGQGWAGDVVYS